MVKKYVKRQISKDNWIEFRGLSMLIKKGVFHPLFFFSTKFLIEFLEKESIEEKRILELGAGSGLISFYCESKKKAIVTASDISPIAIDGLKFNRNRLRAKLQIIHSDLFKNIPKQVFDYIIINPPYYPKKAVSEEDFAWYCGENFEYFSSLFVQIEGYFNENSKILMVLSDDCKIERIAEISKPFGFTMILLQSKKFYFEKNFIFRIVKIDN
ncbi:methyltransferase [Emticicia sp. SJ17W-69]|uniref:methyltransferase n=1 Tax=Emticicia sp. SJ17W-69 TaxID=3421657 RepID=UPI003EBCC9E1